MGMSFKTVMPILKEIFLDLSHHSDLNENLSITKLLSAAVSVFPFPPLAGGPVIRHP